MCADGHCKDCKSISHSLLFIRLKFNMVFKLTKVYSMCTMLKQFFYRHGILELLTFPKICTVQHSICPEKTAVTRMVPFQKVPYLLLKGT